MLRLLVMFALRPTKTMQSALHLKPGDKFAAALSSTGNWLRGQTGSHVGKLGRRPEQRVVLYQTEGCPYSRKVREALSILDLDAEIRPCPRGGQRYLREAEQLGGKAQFPLLIDPNTGAQLYESNQIVKYLFESYGAERLPLGLRLGPLSDLSSRVATALSGGLPSAQPTSLQPSLGLELWAYETDTGSRRARRALDRFELPYTLYSIAQGSTKRKKLSNISASAQVPYLVDPNRGVHLEGADAIVSHLERTYGSGDRRQTSYREFVGFERATT